MSKLPLILLASLPIVACVNEGTGTETSEDVAAALELDNGGFDTTDEAPSFDEATLFDASAIEPDAAVIDEMATEMGDVERTPGARIRNIVLVWGRMPADPTATDVRDWSGRLELNRGGMLVRRRIAFENPTDRVMPRTRRDVIEFSSRTLPRADGLVLTVVDTDPANAEGFRLRYTPADGGAVRDFDLRTLSDRPIVVDAGDGNRMVLSARDRDECDHGTMRGRWHAVAQNHGVYHGVVANEDGEPIGHVRGIWGTRRNGESVFFGKFINREGGFRGILAGHYENGEFQGRWITRAGEHGLLHGLYFRGDAPRSGGFLARWGETSCRAN